MKRIGCALMTALVRVNQYGKLFELFLDLCIICLLSEFEYVVWVYKLVVQEPIELVVLCVLVIFRAELAHLLHESIEFSLKVFVLLLLL